MGNVRILIALDAALLTLFNLGCSGPFSRPQATAATSNFATASRMPWEPGPILLSEQSAVAQEFPATDVIPLIQQASCNADEHRTCALPINERPILSSEPGVPLDANGEVLNPFRGGHLDGFAIANKRSQEVPSDSPSTEIIASDTLAEVIVPSVDSQAELKDSAKVCSDMEPAPCGRPHSESPVENVPQVESPPQVIIESMTSAIEILPSPSAAQGLLKVALTETVIDDVPLVEPAQLDLRKAEAPPAKSPAPLVSPIVSPSSATVESGSCCDIPEPPALIAAMNFLDGSASNPTSGIYRQAARVATTAIPPPAPPVSTQLESLTDSPEEPSTKEVRTALRAEHAIATTPTPSSLPLQALAAKEQETTLTSPMPAPIPTPPTLQIALSPDSPVTTIPMSATFSGPNGQAQALLVIRVETTPQLNVTTPIAQPATPHPSSIASELPEEPRPVQQPVAVQPNPIESSFSTDQLCVWRRTKPPTKSRDVEAPSVSNRISQHLSHSLAQ